MGDCDRGEGGGGVDGIVVKGCKKGAKKIKNETILNFLL
ncbi:Uncharacterised protein [Streptococcus pyogenes]|nr:hypothetical protein HMPREF1244_1347 [Streptococcus pyogenes GA19702]SQF51872.1 Uncharacterised protein [Streptococcus pyogenes]SQG19121.1 Uncharacterised protein [Streptococcus pyogenes]SQG23000.1 Uncharacterised protein [Streptococcus pyogenes]SQG24170.1 Uncharacterised protein [Streptococcus pyogenes]